MPQTHPHIFLSSTLRNSSSIQFQASPSRLQGRVNANRASSGGRTNFRYPPSHKFTFILNTSNSPSLFSLPVPPVSRALTFILLELPLLIVAAITSQMLKDPLAPVVDASGATVTVDGAPLVLSGSDSGSLDSHEDTSATMSSCTISDAEPRRSDPHNLSSLQDMDTDAPSHRSFSPNAFEDDDDILHIDMAEDEAIQEIHSSRYIGDIKHRNCDCTCSRHFTSCQLVQRLRISCARGWAGALRLRYGIDGFESLKQLARVPQSVLLKQFRELIRFVEGGNLAHATILAFSIRRVRGKKIFSFVDDRGLTGSYCGCPDN
ncbi:hypothetical protein NMY22_g14000 [Coprinellus aureogranulatus]|nr:hypothetical protein NMY22_g14000 [Coprinellus aureogranulatus]